MESLTALTPLLILDDEIVGWHRKKNDAGIEVFSRGYATINGLSVEEGQLAHELLQLVDANSDLWLNVVASKLPNVNGNFAVIYRSPIGELLVATDRIRSIPMFWGVAKDSIVVSDRAYKVAEAIGEFDCDDVSTHEFLLCGYVTGNDTLIRNVRQLRAAEMLIQHLDKRAELTQYFRYYPDQVCSTPHTLEESAEKISMVCLDSVRRCIDGLKPGTRIILPLSGGLDSRMIAGSLKRLGVSNVTCFTYGKKDWDDVHISREVATALEYEWHFLPFSTESWSDLVTSRQMQSYCQFAVNAVSLPMLQHWFAIQSLVDKLQINTDDAVVLTGHSLDMVAGSHIPIYFLNNDSARSSNSAENHIWNQHYSLQDAFSCESQWSDNVRHKISRISTIPVDSEPVDSETVQDIHRCEMWNVESRQALWIVNDVRAYEYSGLRWRTLWDNELIELFRNMPLEHRVGQRAYCSALRDHLFTGEALSLGKIGVAGYGKFDNKLHLRKTNFSPPEENRTRSLFAKAKSIIKLGCAFAGIRAGGLSVHPCHFERLFSKAADPRIVLVRQALKGFDLSHVKSQAFQEAYRRLRNLRLADISPSSQLALVTILIHEASMEKLQRKRSFNECR